MFTFVVFRSNKLLGLYDNETAAYIRSCERILSYIEDGTDDLICNMNNIDEATIAKKINDFIKTNDYKMAVGTWNDHCSFTNRLFIRTADVLASAICPAGLDDSFFKAIYSSPPAAPSPTNFVASKPGQLVEVIILCQSIINMLMLTNLMELIYVNNVNCGDMFLNLKNCK